MESKNDLGGEIVAKINVLICLLFTDLCHSLTKSYHLFTFTDSNSNPIPVVTSWDGNLNPTLYIVKVLHVAILFV